MRTLLAVALVLALVAPLGAETYSWVDDSGTYNFTEDFSKVPRKYRKKVRLRGDLSSPEAPPSDDATAASDGTSPAADTVAGKNGGSAAPRLFGGKSEQAWRSELNMQELELTRLEGLFSDQQKEIQIPGGVTRERLTELIKEREQARTEYNRKYKEYLELLDSARRAGFAVEMKKKQ